MIGTGIFLLKNWSSAGTNSSLLTTNDQRQLYRNTLCANAASSAGFPMGAQTCWFHCFFRSFACSGVPVCALRDVGMEVCGINAAKLLTVVRIRFTAAVIRAERVGLEICADCSTAGKFWLRSEMAPWIFCSVVAFGLALYSLYKVCSRLRSRLACAEMF